MAIANQTDSDFVLLSEFLAKGTTPESLTHSGPAYSIGDDLDLSKEGIQSEIAYTSSVQSMSALEYAIKKSITALRPICDLAKQGNSPHDLQESLYAHSELMLRTFDAHLRVVMEETAQLEKEVGGHAMFCKRAMIPAEAADLNEMIEVVPLSRQELVNHPQFGVQICIPQAKAGNIHELPSQLVTSGDLRTNDELAMIGAVMKATGADAFVSLHPSVRENSHRLFQQKDGEDYVVVVDARLRLRQASIYEKADTYFDGQFDVAAILFHQRNVLEEVDRNDPTGCNPRYQVAQPVNNGKEPLLYSYSRRMDEMPMQVVVGASATDYNTESTSLVNYYYRARSPMEQIHIRTELRELRRVLAIHGHRLRVPAQQLDSALRSLELEWAFISRTSSLFVNWH